MGKKKGNFSFITIKKKKKKSFFFKKNKRLLYIDTFFFGEEREGVYFKFKYLLPYLQFFFLTLSKSIFGKSV